MGVDDWGFSVIRSGHRWNDGTVVRGCNACQRDVPDGEALILYDDQEYMPTFCGDCLRRALNLLKGDLVNESPTRISDES